MYGIKTGGLNLKNIKILLVFYLYYEIYVYGMVSMLNTDILVLLLVQT